MGFNFGRRVGAKIARGQPFQKLRALRVGARGVVDTGRSEFPGQGLIGQQVRLPELFQPPRRHGLRIDRADIGVCEHRECLQTLNGPNLGGQQLARRAVGQVARGHHAGQRQVLVDQEFHSRAIGGGSFQPLQDEPRDP